MKTDKEGYDLIGAIIDFENDELNQEQTIELFTHLIRTGKVFALQGSYQRAAADLVAAGLVTA